VGLRLLGVRLWQLVTVQALLAGVAVAAAHDSGLLTPAVILAALGIVTVLGRQGHQPILTWLAIRASYRSRRSRATASDDDGPRLAPLRELLPALDLGGITVRDGQRLAVCFDGSGWSAVIALHQDNDVLAYPSTAPRLPLTTLVEAMHIDDIPLASLQVLVHTVPAPDTRFPDTSPIAASYRQLAGPRVPAARQTFLVLRIDAVTGRQAIAARGGGTDGARRALKRSISRLLEVLAAAGVPSRPLAEAPWLAAISEIAGTAQPPHLPATPPASTPRGNDRTPENRHTPESRRTRESRRTWQVDDLTHLTWWVRAWPDDATPLQTLIDLAAQVPAASTQVSYTLYPAAPGTLRCRALIRTSAPSPEAAETAATALLQNAAASAGQRLHRLDGEHAPGYLATLPLGGGTL
jgi:type VII secretion protein EccE